MIIHDSTSRSKRYYGESGGKKPHIFLGKYDRKFLLAHGSKYCTDLSLQLTMEFVSKLNRARAKS